MKQNRRRDTDLRPAAVGSHQTKTQRPWGAGPGLTKPKPELTDNPVIKRRHSFKEKIQAVMRTPLRRTPSPGKGRFQSQVDNLPSPMPSPEPDSVMKVINEAIAGNIETAFMTTPIASKHTTGNVLPVIQAGPSPIFMTSRVRALHCEMDDPSMRVPFVGGRRDHTLFSLGWFRNAFTTCMRLPATFCEDDSFYDVPVILSRRVDVNADHVPLPEAEASSPQPSAQREPTPLPQLTIHMSPLRQSMTSLPLDRRSLTLFGSSPAISPTTVEQPTERTVDDFADFAQKEQGMKAPQIASATARKQTAISLAEILAKEDVRSGRRDISRGIPVKEGLDTDRMRQSMRKRLQSIKGYGSAPSSPAKGAVSCPKRGGLYNHGLIEAVGPVSAPATPLEKLLRPAVVPRLNKAAQIRASAVRARLEKLNKGAVPLCDRKQGRMGEEEEVICTNVLPPGELESMNGGQVDDNLLQRMRDAAEAAGVDLQTYQASRQQYLHMLQRLAIGLDVDPAIVHLAKQPSPPSSCLSVLSSSSSGNAEAEHAAVKCLTPNQAFGHREQDAEFAALSQRMVTLTDVVVANKVKNASIKARRSEDSFGSCRIAAAYDKETVHLESLLSGLGMPVTESLTFADLEQKGITLKDLLRIKVRLSS